MNVYELNQLVLGCMRLVQLDEKQLDTLINTAMECGINHFDHADIYGRGTCETVFGTFLASHSDMREKMVIQTKCGIIPGKRYDSSKEHILASVDGSLKRLQTEYVDMLLLHRPDPLMIPSEVADAFRILKEQGKVRAFGVSNYTPNQITLLNRELDEDMKICLNQMQFSAAHAGMVSQGMQTNMQSVGAVDRDGGILDYCRLENIRIQAWSPLQYGMIEGAFLKNPEFKDLNEKLAEIGSRYHVTAAAVALAWIMRHPANMQVICGSVNLEHFKEITEASSIRITGDEWYEIYLAAGNLLP